MSTRLGTTTNNKVNHDDINWTRLKKFAFFTLVATALTTTSGLASNADAMTRGVTVSFGYTPPSEPTVTGYCLYESGTLQVCKTLAQIKTDGSGDTSFTTTVNTTSATETYTLTAKFSDGTESPHSAPFVSTWDKEGLAVSTTTAGVQSLITLNDDGTVASSMAIGPFSTWKTINSGNYSSADGGWVALRTDDKKSLCLWLRDDSGNLTAVSGIYVPTYGGVTFDIASIMPLDDVPTFKVVSKYATPTGDQILVENISKTGAALAGTKASHGPFTVAGSTLRWDYTELGYNSFTEKYYVAMSRHRPAGTTTVSGDNLAIVLPLTATNGLGTPFVMNPPEIAVDSVAVKTDFFGDFRGRWDAKTTTGALTGRTCLDSTSPTGVLIAGSQQCFGPYIAASVPWMPTSFFPYGETNASLFWTRQGVGLSFFINGTANTLGTLQTFTPATGYAFTQASKMEGEQMTLIAEKGADRQLLIYSAPTEGIYSWPLVRKLQYTAASNSWSVLASLYNGDKSEYIAQAPSRPSAIGTVLEGVAMNVQGKNSVAPAPAA